MKIFIRLSFLTMLLLTLNCKKKETKIEENLLNKFLHTEIFPSQKEHTHGSTIVQLPNGDMLAAWFQGHGERWADDVRIMGARLLKGENNWTKPFIMADVPDFPDINPVLFLDNKETLWLVWYTVIANQWETSLPKYRISNDYMQKNAAPKWDWQDVIHFKPGNSTERGIQPKDKFIVSIEKQIETQKNNLISSGISEEQLEMYNVHAKGLLSKARGENMIKKGTISLEDGSKKNTELGYPYFRRMGWQTKNKPLQIENKIIIPFYSDGLDISIMAITEDYGVSWSFSDPLVGIANIQPSLALKKDGTITAYMRDNGPPPQRHPISTSTDNGLTWSTVIDSEIMNEGSGSDIVTLSSGNWILAYNDTEKGRYTLAVSLSEDEGKTWKYIRHIELDENRDLKKRNRASYPSIIQGKGGMIHVVYTYQKYNTFPYDDTQIKYIRFTEDWIRKGD